MTAKPGSGHEPVNASMVRIVNNLVLMEAKRGLFDPMPMPALSDLMVFLAHLQWLSRAVSTALRQPPASQCNRPFHSAIGPWPFLITGFSVGSHTLQR